MAHGDVLRDILLNTPYRILAAIACVLTNVGQQSILNYYLIIYKGHWHYIWIVADVAVIGVFIAAFTISIHNLHSPPTEAVNKPSVPPNPKKLGELPMGYITWLLYSVILSAKVAILYYYVAPHLQERKFMGPNMLKTAVALSALVFVLLITTHHNAKPNSARKDYIDALVGGVTFDLLDTTQFLEVLFVEVSGIEESFELHKAIIGCSCINLIMPVLPLIALSQTRYGNPEYTKLFKALHHFFYLTLVNLPLFIIRLLMWHVYTNNISVFLIKNILSLAMGFWKLVHECSAANEKLTDQVNMEMLEISPAQIGEDSAEEEIHSIAT